MAILRSDLWGSVARNLGGVYLESTATGGTTLTIVDTTALQGQYADDYLNDCWVSIITDAGGAHAAPEGQSRRVSDFVGSTGTITVPTAFSASPANGDTYRLWSVAPKAELLDAVAEALRAAWPAFYQRVVDTSLSFADDTYEYTLPAGIEYLQEVEIQGNGDSDYYEPVHNWRTRKESGGTRTLILDHTQSYTTGYSLRLVGIGPLDYPANDYTAVSVQAEYEDALLQYVASYGAALLLDRLMLRDSGHDRVLAHRYDVLMSRAREAKQHGMARPDARVTYRLPAYWS